MKKLAILAILATTAFAGEVTVAWMAQAGVTDYRVWRGIECLAVVSQPQADVMLPDEPCVITVTARNAAGESAHSAPLEVIAVTVEESRDLKSWTSCRTIHREKKTAAFYRLKIQTGGAP